jgi:hypothetical protein
MGGLGNQMFQVAAAYALAKYHNTDFKLDLSFLLKNNKTTEIFTARNYELNVFDYNFYIATEEEKALFVKKKKNIFEKIKFKYLNCKLIEENQEGIEFFHNSTKNTYINGYWQNEDYFKEHKKDILKLFSFKELPMNLHGIRNEILNANSVSIHIRRGDYVTNSAASSFHGLCSMEYYISAIKIMNSKVINPVFFIFSDDEDWVKENFIINQPYHFVSKNKSIDDLHLMKLCKHNIIANSSFSWWGAWLNENIDKVVVAPSQWFVDQKKNNETKDLIPDAWIRL